MDKRKYVLIAAVAIAMAFIAVVATYMLVNWPHPTARDYYYQHVHKNQFASYTSTDAELQRIIKSLGYHQSLDDIRKILSEEGTPDKELLPFFEEIKRNTPKKYKAPTDDIFAGVDLLGDINARTIRSPEGGYLILVNYKLKKALWEWIKLSVTAVSVEMNLRQPSPENSLDAIKSTFIRSMSEYVSEAKVPAFPEYLHQDQQPLVDVMYIAAVKFCLAHEYAHILLGHIQKRAERFEDINNHANESAELFSAQQEMDADLLATEILMDNASLDKSLKQTDIETKGSGIIFALSILIDIESMTKKKGEKADLSSTLYRLILIKNFISEKYFAAGTHPVTSSMLVAIDYLFMGAFAANQKSETSQPELDTLPQKEQPRQKVILKPTASSASKAEAEGKAAEMSDFIAFMREFSEYKQKGDWLAMSNRVKREMQQDKYVDILLDHALATSAKGVKSLDLPWDPSQEASASGYVEFALAILAASQQRTEIRGVVLPPNLRSRILLIWRSVYYSSLAAVGMLDGPPPDQLAVQEAFYKTEAALKISEDLDDVVLSAFGVLAGAYIAERTGEKQRSAEIRQNLGIDLGYPPIQRGSDGRIRILQPKLDAKGNEVPGAEGEEVR
ncbi:MAG: hypothetical protein WCL60_15680 [Methylococcales bacterium]